MFILVAYFYLTIWVCLGGDSWFGLFMVCYVVLPCFVVLFLCMG